jgi:hypothetical protein
MKHLLLSLLAVLAFTACEGPTGPRGESGNLYDYTTFVYTIGVQNWVQDGDVYYSDINAPEITYDILDYGYFITYINTGTSDNPVYIELPQTQLYTDNNGVPYTLEFYPTYRLGKVSIEYYDTHPTNPLAPGKEYSFRTVIVSDPYVKNAIINKKIGTDYNSVMKAIKDHKDNQVVIR